MPAPTISASRSSLNEIQVAAGMIDDESIGVAAGRFHVDGSARREAKLDAAADVLRNRGCQCDPVARLDPAVGADAPGIADMCEVRGDAQVGAQLVRAFDHLAHLLERRIAV